MIADDLVCLLITFITIIPIRVHSCRGGQLMNEFSAATVRVDETSCV